LPGPRDEIAVIRRLVDEQRALGLELEFLGTTAAVREREPALAPTVLAASFCPTDGSADPVASVRAFAQAAERHGARLVIGERVHGIEVTGGGLQAVTTNKRRSRPAVRSSLCGAFGNDLLAPIGLTVPLRQPMVTVLQTEPNAAAPRPVLGVANADMGGAPGGQRPASGDERCRRLARAAHDRSRAPRGTHGRQRAQVVEKLRHVLPAFANCPIHRVWAGLLDLTPDALPVLDHVPGAEGLLTAMGFSGHGFAIGPITGAIMADLVQEKPPGFDLSPFRFARFNSAGAPEAGLTLHG
jgi:sarcosine oxidase subunit beta